MVDHAPSHETKRVQVWPRTTSLQKHRVYSSLKIPRNGRFQVVSTWNTRVVFVGTTNPNLTCIWFNQKRVLNTQMTQINGFYTLILIWNFNLNILKFEFWYKRLSRRNVLQMLFFSFLINIFVATYLGLNSAWENSFNENLTNFIKALIRTISRIYDRDFCENS